MRNALLPLLSIALLSSPCTAQNQIPKAVRSPEVGKVSSHSRGLHGYIGFGHEKLPADGAYNAGMGFYAAVWPLVDQPLANFQIGLPSSWIQPDNSDNKDTPLAPEGTLARTWKPRGPTWSSVFQTVEGGLGYWARTHFRYGPPKFSMNATPQCYDYEIGSPGWSFFYDNEALPDHRLGIAQLSNRLLIPPDALPFQGHPNGEFLGYTWMALPFTDPTTGDPPTGDQSWTCFLSAANFKGPIAYYIPETWSKIGKLFNYPFIYGRGLDARPGVMGGGAMEINTVPRFDANDAQGTTYSKLPKLQFPVDAQGRALLVQDVTYYSKAALYDAFKSWRDGGPACSGRFDDQGAWKPALSSRPTRYDQAGKKIAGVERVFENKIFEGNVWGLQWLADAPSPQGVFPQYSKHVGEERVVIAPSEVPPETGLSAQKFKLAEPGVPYTSPETGAWANPGPKTGPFTAPLVDGSVVTYAWYRFVDQPSFQQYAWSAEKKAKLQSFVEKLHANWPIDRDYMPPPGCGKLVSLDPGLFVTPPPGLEVGYVPIVIRQALGEPRQIGSSWTEPRPQSRDLRSIESPDAASVPEARSGTGTKSGPWAIEPAPALPNVLILGDSISIGYTLAVSELLAGKANVLRPCSPDGSRPENCQGTTLGVREIDRWLSGHKWDVIHFNWGLHDLRHVRVAGGAQNSTSLDDPRQAEPEVYERNLREIVGKLKATGAKLIFAPTTPFPPGTSPARLPEDARRYNDIALRIMEANRVGVNDLYALVAGRLEGLQNPQNVHFNQRGNDVLADRVAHSIQQALRDRK